MHSYLISSPPKSFWFIFCLINTTFASISRFVLRDLLLYLITITNKSKVQKVGIYGAGSAGAQLAASLKLDGNYSTMFFFDDHQIYGNELEAFQLNLLVK